MRGLGRTILHVCVDHGIAVVFVALCIAAALRSDQFLTFGNWRNILNNFAVTGVVAFGVTVVVIAGGIDLSFGSILTCCAVVAASLHPYPFPVPLGSALMVGALLGALNGTIVAIGGVNPLIATLGTQWLYLAVLFVLTDGGLVQGGDDGLLAFLGQGRLYGVPYSVFVLAGACMATAFLLRHTRFGKYVYAHGSNSTALTCSGVNASRVYCLTFVVMGLLAGLAGLLLSARLGGVRPTEGSRYLITVLTAVILGGVSLQGGVGSVTHVLLAVLILGVVDNTMILFAVPYKDQQVIRGLVFVGSVIYNHRMTRWRDALPQVQTSRAEA